MKIVIDISEKVHNALTHTEFDANLVVDEMRKAIANGTPLLEQQPCEDCISREAVLDIINFEDEWLYDANGHNANTKIAFSGLKSGVKDLPSVTPKAEWIPCSERLPEKLKDVLVTFYDCPGEYDVAYLRTTFNETYKKNGVKNEWVSSMGETTYADYEVDAWMPIEPYKESEE